MLDTYKRQSTRMHEIGLTMDTTAHSERRAAGAGLIAAAVMVAVQLVWRVLDSENNVVQAFPEFIATAIARLTPLETFGTVTETYGSLAKKSLLTACVIGVVAVGALAGNRALAFAGGSRATAGRRLIGGLIVAALLLAFTLAVVLPVANLGFAASDSSYRSEILTQLVLTFALWAVLWTVLSANPAAEPTTSGQQMTRRTAIQSLGWTALGIGSVIAVFGSLRDMFRVEPLSDAEVAQQEQAVQDIVAAQRPAETVASPAAIAPSTVGTPATTFGQFEELEAKGRLTGLVTPTKDFYHVSKNFTDPTVGLDGWSLEIGGLVNTPRSYSYDELTALAATRNITTLCCISNELNGSLISTAEWTGVPLIDLLNEVGVKPEAIDVKFSSADDYTDSIPYALAQQDRNILVVIAMNGEALPDDHGFPARMIVPPIYGMKNPKWLQKIELVDEDYMGYWQERGWSETAEYQIWGRIDFPGSGEIDPGPQIASGVASAGNRDVSRVEVSLDDGASWADAQLEPSLNPPFTWVRWAFPFEAVSGRLKMKMRVTDGTGELMREEKNPPLPDGATGWPGRTVTVRDA